MQYHTVQYYRVAFENIIVCVREKERMREREDRVQPRFATCSQFHFLSSPWHVTNRPRQHLIKTAQCLSS